MWALELRLWSTCGFDERSLDSLPFFISVVICASRGELVSGLFPGCVVTGEPPRAMVCGQATGKFSMIERARVFDVDRVDEVVVVAPLGDESSFRYFDIHSQANRVMRALDDGTVLGVVIDLGSVKTLGWVMTSAIVRLVRNLDYRGGLAVYCSASESNVSQLSAMKLGQPWTHHDTRGEAVEAIRSVLTNAEGPSGEDG